MRAPALLADQHVDSSITPRWRNPLSMGELGAQEEGDSGFDVVGALPRPLNSAHRAPNK
jgi:hypothetical protein